MRVFAPFVALFMLAACATNDLADAPVPLGDFQLGLNVVVADKMQKVPISRPATVEEWELAMQQAVDARFGRYEGTKLYNLGISVDGFALAPPGIPVVAAPKSILVITANIWDDAAQTKLNAKGKQLTVFEGLSPESVIGSGLTRTKAQQMEALSYNAVKAVERWLLTNPEWFGIDPAAAKAALVAAEIGATAAEKAAKAAAAEPVVGDPVAEVVVGPVAEVALAN